MIRAVATTRGVPGGNSFARPRPMASTDRLLVGARIGVGLGPLDLPSPGELRSAFVRIAAGGHPARLGLVLADDRRWREVGMRIADRADEIFRVAPESVGDPRDWLLDHWIDDLPVQFAIAGDRLGMLMDHRLGDGALASVLPLALIDLARGRPLASAFTGLIARPLGAALSHTFGVRPTAWLGLADDYRRHRPRNSPPAQAAERHLAVPSTCHLNVVLEPDRLLGVRAWSRGRIALGPVLAQLTGQAMRVAGLPVADTGELVIDLRRYLPRGAHTLANFIAGMEIPLAGPGSAPAEVHAQVTRSLLAGRPLVAATIGAARGRLAGSGLLRPVPRRAPEPRPASAARISMSSLGRLRAFEKLPWTAPQGQRWMDAYTEPATPGTLGVIAIAMDGRLNLSLTWRGEDFDRATVAAGAALLADDPVRLLEGLVDR
ncbi:MAG: hypothetical protein KDB60_06785 [Propionibacteriaceae bacterium]|nr:hypothetical protein [Propionibacteriaceae bacterium]